jgi:hypothetical protein
MLSDPRPAFHLHLGALPLFEGRWSGSGALGLRQAMKAD